MSPSKFSGVTLRTGDQVKILMPGGGGYGDPRATRPRRSCGATSRRGSSARRRRARSTASTGRRPDVGEWKAGEISYLKANRAACALCGHPIAIRYWGAEVNGVEQTFCSPDHERLYHDYWLPRYGAKAKEVPDMTRKPVLSQEAPQPSGRLLAGDRRGRLPLPRRPGPVRRRGRRASATTIAEQVRQVLENLDAVARAAGGSLQQRGSLRDVHQRHGALRRDGRRVPRASSPSRCRRARRSSPTSSASTSRATRSSGSATDGGRRPRSTRRSRRSTWTRSSATSRGCRATATSTGSPSGPHIKTHKLPAIAHMQLPRGRGRDHLPEARRGRGDGGRRPARHPAHVPARRRREGRAARGARRRGRRRGRRRLGRRSPAALSPALAARGRRGRLPRRVSTPASRAPACRRREAPPTSPSSSTRCPGCASTG